MRKFSSLLLSALLLPFMAEAASDRTVDAGVIEFKQTAPDPATPSAGYNKCWVKPADGKLYCLNSAGEEARVQDSKMKDLILEDPVSGDSITLEAATPSAGSFTLKLPTEDGTNGQAIKTDGNGNLSFGDAGGGGAGINLITLDTAANAWAISKGTNFDLEATVGDWAAYADAAATEPVDMTGGSPGTTCARDTAGAINGAGSLKMDLGSGSSRQGEGCSILVNVPTAYRGKNVAFVFPFTISGALVENDLKLAAYDVTNGALISVFSRGKLLGESGQAIGVIAIPPTAAQIRVGMHVARSTTAALSLIGDDFQVSPQIPAQGAIVTKWTSYTPNYTGFGTVSNSNIEWRRNGDSLELRGSFVSGVATGDLATMSLPPGLSAVAMVAHPQKAGSWTQSTSLAGNGMVLISSGESVIEFGYETGSQAGLLENNGNGIISSGVRLSLNGVAIPIAGWESNINLSDSSTFWISSFLANGTRVTGTQPARLGEWRSQLRNGGAGTFSDTNGTPSDLPSVTNGIRIYAGNTYASTDTTNQPTRYDIFVGKNKNVFPIFYASTGRTGFVDANAASSPDGSGGTSTIGYIDSYDPSTGIYTIMPYYYTTATTSHNSGMSGPNAAVDDIYFDIKVSENALAVGADLYTFSAFGGFTISNAGQVFDTPTSSTTWENGSNASWGTKSLLGSATAGTNGDDLSFKMAYLPAGTYEVSTNAQVASTAGAICAGAIYDGSSRFGTNVDSNYSGQNVVDSATIGAAVFKYSSAQTNKEFSLQIYGTSTSNCRILSRENTSFLLKRIGD